MKTIKQILIYLFLIFMICPTNIFAQPPETPPPPPPAAPGEPGVTETFDTKKERFNTNIGNILSDKDLSMSIAKANGFLSIPNNKNQMKSTDISEDTQNKLEEKLGTLAEGDDKKNLENLIVNIIFVRTGKTVTTQTGGLGATPTGMQKPKSTKGGPDISSAVKLNKSKTTLNNILAKFTPGFKNKFSTDDLNEIKEHLAKVIPQLKDKNTKNLTNLFSGDEIAAFPEEKDLTEEQKLSVENINKELENAKKILNKPEIAEKNIKSLEKLIPKDLGRSAVKKSILESAKENLEKAKKQKDFDPALKLTETIKKIETILAQAKTAAANIKTLENLLKQQDTKEKVPEETLNSAQKSLKAAQEANKKKDFNLAIALTKAIEEINKILANAKTANQNLKTLEALLKQQDIKEKVPEETLNSAQETLETAKKQIEDKNYQPAIELKETIKNINKAIKDFDVKQKKEKKKQAQKEKAEKAQETFLRNINDIVNNRNDAGKILYTYSKPFCNEELTLKKETIDTAKKTISENISKLSYIKDKTELQKIFLINILDFLGIDKNSVMQAIDINQVTIDNQPGTSATNDIQKQFNVKKAIKAEREAAKPKSTKTPKGKKRRPRVRQSKIVPKKTVAKKKIRTIQELKKIGLTNLVKNIFEAEAINLAVAITDANTKLTNMQKGLKATATKEQTKQKITIDIEKNKREIPNKITGDEFIFKFTGLNDRQQNTFYTFLKKLGVDSEDLKKDVANKVKLYTDAKEFKEEITEVLTVDNQEPAEEEINFPLIAMTKLGKDYFVEELISKASNKDFKNALKLNGVEIDVDATNDNGQTAMHVAINSGDLNAWNVFKSINYLISGEKPQLSQEKIEKLPLLERVKYIEDTEDLKSKIDDSQQLQPNEQTALKSFVDLEKEEISFSKKTEKIETIFGTTIEKSEEKEKALAERRGAIGQITAEEFEKKIEKLNNIKKNLSKYFAPIHEDVLDQQIKETEEEKTEAEKEDDDEEEDGD